MTRPSEPSKANGLLRAAGLQLLPANDPDVCKELDRAKAGTALSHLSDDTLIPARIAGF